MAVGIPTFKGSADTVGGAPPFATPSFSIVAGESIIASQTMRAAAVELGLTLNGSIAPDEVTTIAASEFLDFRVQISVWHDPGAGNYTVNADNAGFQQTIIAATVTGAPSTGILSGEVTGFGTGGATDTGAVNVTSEVGDRVFMVVVANAALPVADQTAIGTESAALNNNNEQHALFQHADGAATVDIGASNLGGDQSSWVAINVNAAAGTSYTGYGAIVDGDSPIAWWRLGDS